MTDELTRLLLETGLMQFGRFNSASEPIPFRFSLEVLPAYPDVLRILVARANTLLTSVYANRLLCTADALPFGVGLSLETDIPLVYSRGSKDAPVYDLVGAYDIGHPALLLTNVLGDFEPVAQLMAGAQRVGLEIHMMLAIVDLGIATIPHDKRLLALLRLPDVIEALSQSGQLPQAHARTVQQWIEVHAHL